MFKLNGNEYSLEEVTSAAESSNLSVDEYVNEFGLETVEVTDEIQTEPKGKTSDVAVVDAAVTSEPDTASESTGLNSENYFSVPPSEILEEGKFVRTEEGVRFAEEGEIILAEPEKGLVAPIMLDEFDIIEYKKQQQQDENQAAREIMLSVTGLSEPTEDEIQEQKSKEGELKPITEFEEAQRISKGQIEFRKQAEERAKRIAEGSEFLSYQENIANNVANGLRLLTSVDDNARWLWYWAGSQDSDLLRNMYGDEKAEEILAKNRTGLAKATADIDAINAMQAPTIGFTDLPERKGSEYIPGFGLVDSKITGGVSAAIGAVTQTGASIGLQVGTGGVGLASTMIAESVKDYNETKANELGINLEDLVFSGEAETFVPAALGALSYGLEKLPNNKILDYIKSIPTSSRRQMVSFMNTVGANGFQEIGQLGIETFNTGLAEGKTVGEAGAAAGRVMVSKEGFEAGLQGAFGSAGLALSGRSLKASGSIRTDSENKRIQNYIDQISSLENSKFQKNITAEEIGVINTAQQEIKNNIVEEVNKNNILVASFTDDQLETVNKNTDFLTESASKINETEASTDLSRQDKDIIINAIEQSRNRASQEIYNIRNEAEAFVGDLRKARKATETLQDVEIKDFKTTEEINKFLEDQDQNIDTKASEQQAFVIQNPETGKQTVVINRSLAGKEAIKHEVGHVLLYETVKNRPETAINLGNALLSELDKIDAAQIKDSNFKKRMEQYSDQTREVQMEEAITLFSDAINTGDIKFEENIFTKLGDRVRRVMQRFGVDVKFNNGRDVYNFVKDYNKSLEKGSLSLAQVQAATKGVEGELVTPAEQQADEQIIKESRSEEASNRVQEIYDEQGEAGAFDIIEQFKPITSRIVERRSEAPGFDRQLLTDEIETGQRGIIDLIKEYKPESGVPLAAYINKFLPARAIEASKRVLGEEFTEDVTEARGVAAEEVVTETAIKPEAKAIDPFRIMPNVKETATAEVQKSIADKDVDVTEVTYKELKDVAPYQTVADFFNIPVSRIKNPKDNLRKSDDVANIQRWILKNEPTLKNLFTEANRDVIEVTEGNRVIRQGGEPTAIPRNLLNKFYTKGDRVGNNFQWKLKPYDRTTFLEAVGIRDGKVDPDFTPRAAEAQTIKGILDMYTRNLGNVAARETIEAREDIAPAERARAKAEVAKGKPRLMFSKEVDSALTPGQSQNIGKVFNKLGNQEKITFVQNIDPFFDAITKDDYNVETAFNNIFGPDFLKGKKKQDFINEWSKVRGSLVDLKNYNKGKPKETTVQDYLYQAFEEQTQSEVVENILGVKKGGVNFRSKDQLMGYVNFINSYIAKKAESLNDFELAEFVINDLGPTLSAGAKVGGNDFMWQRDADTDLLVLVPSTLDRSNSIRTSLFGNQREMAEVLIKPFISDKSKLTYKGNKPLWNGVPLLKKGYKVDQSVNTYLTSIKKNGGITNEMLDKSQEYADQQVKNIIDILDYYKSLPKDSETTIDDLGMFFRASNGDMTAMVRAAANVDSFAGDGKGAYRYEHNPPARTMLVRMAEYVNGTITKQELKNEFDKYTVSIIPQQMDDVINERYKDTVPLVGSRYYNAFTYGRFPFAMNVYKKQSDGSYKTETIGEYQKQAYESQIKASRSNNNQLMPVVKFAKQVPNSEVLNRMSELDANAKQANKEFYDSVDLNKEFNDILEVKTGIASEKRYKRVKAEVVGANKGRFQFFIPPSAEDFTGLLYSTLAKGKLGDAQMAWYKKNLLDPYGKAMNELSSARIAMMNDYKQLKKELQIVPKDLRKKVPGEPFTREQAVRVYIWQKQGMSVPGISEADMQDLSEYVANDTELQLFAEQLINIQKGDQYAGPKEGWPAGTITTDMLEGLNTIKRAKALEQWQTNADEIFSEENLNKLEAAYGKPYRKAMENMLQRMKSGRNRNFQGDTLTGRFTDWVTGSIGTIMFFNTRSALLQTISSINFVNFTDNNILAAGKAFANQKQYWSDFMTLMNSDFLKERRGGLRINVSEADIADMAKKGGAKGVINKLLEFGFTPTQIADSFAIASGGATFYRNRIKSLKKQGMTDAEAEAQAFVDFRETAEESQQSSRPDRISMQQAGPLGRLVLAFANTPAQYARLIKKAASDLKNGRGDAKTNISKIIYYGVAQNLLFNALQQALFAFAFDDDEEDTEEQQKKYVGIANGMMDSLLRGMGLGGAVVSVGKNAIIRIINEMEKKQPKLEKVGYEITKLSPPISAKLSRINQAARSYQWDKKDMMEKGWSLDNPAYLASANVIAALTNIPLDRAVKKTNNVVQATSQDLETWERLALLGGWQDWEIGVDEEKPSNKPQPRKRKFKKKKF